METCVRSSRFSAQRTNVLKTFPARTTVGNRDRWALCVNRKKKTCSPTHSQNYRFGIDELAVSGLLQYITNIRNNVVVYNDH